MKAHNSKENERLGLTFTNDFGTVYKIVEYKEAGDVTVEFQDGTGYRAKTSWYRCSRDGARIKSPYEKRVAGVGYLGIMKDGTYPITTDGKGNGIKEYTTWVDMLGRCYDPKVQEKCPSYIGCTVCERWHCYANFLEDIAHLDNYNEWVNSRGTYKWELDKDFKQKGIKNKVYSPDTCMFVTVNDNTRESASRGGQRCILIKDNEEYEFASLTKAEEFTGISRKTLKRAYDAGRECRGWTIIMKKEDDK